MIRYGEESDSLTYMKKFYRCRTPVPLVVAAAEAPSPAWQRRTSRAGHCPLRQPGAHAAPVMPPSSRSASSDRPHTRLAGPREGRRPTSGDLRSPNVLTSSDPAAPTSADLSGATPDLTGAAAELVQLGLNHPKGNISADALSNGLWRFTHSLKGFLA